MTESAPLPEAIHGTSREERRAVLLETATDLLATGDATGLRLILNSQRPADLAELLSQLDETARSQAFAALAEPLAAEVLAELDVPEMLDVTGGLGADQLTGLVEGMAPDDAADLLSELPPEQSAALLESMEEEEAQAVRGLLAHDEDTAGGLMTSSLVAVRERMTVADAIEHLRAWGDEDAILYLYVVDDDERLVGTVPLRRLVLSPAQTCLAELADRDVITVSADTDQEEIARTFAAYDLLAVPVVDAQGRLVGRVTVDDVVEVIEDEATEDMYAMAGTSPEELGERSVAGVVRRRLPWLLVCLVGTLLSGSMIDLFHSVLAQIGILMVFVPAIMGMGGNTGIQASTVTVRSLATGQIQTGQVLRTVWRELRVALLMGTILGALVFAVGQAWSGALLVGACVGLAMLAAVVLSAVLGACIPLSFRAVGVDPAVASGPLITTINDTLSLAIYFTVAALLLQLSP